MSAMIPNLSAFLAYIFLSAFTPGPNNIMALSNSGAYGFRRSLRFCLGVFFGFLIIMSACAIAGSWLFSAVPKIEPILRWAGAGYILLLAWLIYRDQGQANGPGASGPSGILTGIMLQLVNVKVIIYGLTALSVFVLPYHDQPRVLALFVLALSLVGLAGTTAWAAFGSLIQKVFTTRRRLVNAVLAASLAACAVSTLLGA